MPSSKLDKPYKCTVNGCEAAFNRPYKLDNHEHKHSGERPFVCTEPGCSKSYISNTHLKRHIAVSHENKKSEEVLCNIEGCGLLLSNKYSLKKHIHRHHNPDNFMYTCEVCSQKFKKKALLRDHMYGHTGKGMYECKVCPKTFMWPSALTKHAKNHKSYECDCGITFQRWSALCKHRKTSCNKKVPDKPHKCIICDKVFAYASLLKEHSMSHLDESQIQKLYCPYLNCKRSYSYEKNLRQHIRNLHKQVVDKKTRLSCTEPGCSMTLISKKTLMQHVRLVHNNLPLKVRKPRRPRKDKGQRKKCMASIITGVDSTRGSGDATISSEINNGVDILDHATSSSLRIERAPMIIVSNNETSMHVVELTLESNEEDDGININLSNTLMNTIAVKI